MNRAKLGRVCLRTVLLVLWTGIIFPNTTIMKGSSPMAGLKLVISCGKADLNNRDPVTLEVKLINGSAERISLFGRLLWNEGFGLSLRVSDGSGHLVPTDVLDDDKVIPSELGDPTSFVVLEPGHFLGVARTDTVANLFKTSGTFTLYVEYRSPVPGHYAKTPNFWGAERGMLKSNSIQISVSKP